MAIFSVKNTNCPVSNTNFPVKNSYFYCRQFRFFPSIIPVIIGKVLGFNLLRGVGGDVAVGEGKIYAR